MALRENRTRPEARTEKFIGWGRLPDAIRAVFFHHLLPVISFSK